MPRSQAAERIPGGRDDPTPKEAGRDLGRALAPVDLREGVERAERRHDGNAADALEETHDEVTVGPGTPGPSSGWRRAPAGRPGHDRELGGGRRTGHDVIVDLVELDRERGRGDQESQRGRR